MYLILLILFHHHQASNVHLILLLFSLHQQVKSVSGLRALYPLFLRSSILRYLLLSRLQSSKLQRLLGRCVQARPTVAEPLTIASSLLSSSNSSKPQSSGRCVPLCAGVVCLPSLRDLYPVLLHPLQQRFRAMNGAHLASPIRGKLSYVHWSQLPGVDWPCLHLGNAWWAGMV